MKKSLTILCFVFLISSCATVDEFVKSTFQQPQVSFETAKIIGLSFNAVDLLFDLKISNPNPVGISLAGFDYDFLLNGNSFIKGEQTDGLDIESNGERTVQIPVSFTFSDMYNTFSSFKNQDSTTYKIACGFFFDLPVLGAKRILVSKSGSLPLLKQPIIRVKSLKLEKMSFAGADLNLGVEIDNPNSFSFLLNAMDYNFDVNGKEWLNGTLSKSMRIESKQSNVIDFPISFNLLQIGISVKDVLTSGKPLSYDFSGNVDLGTSIPSLDKVNLPFKRSGEISIIK